MSNVMRRFWRPSNKQTAARPHAPLRRPRKVLHSELLEDRNMLSVILSLPQDNVVRWNTPYTTMHSASSGEVGGHAWVPIYHDTISRRYSEKRAGLSDGSDTDVTATSAAEGPYLLVECEIFTDGLYAIDLKVRGNGPDSDSLWFQVDDSHAFDGESWLAEESGALLITASSTEDAQWVDAGVWKLSRGMHRFRVSMHESGVAYQGIRLVGVPALNQHGPDGSKGFANHRISVQRQPEINVYAVVPNQLEYGQLGGWVAATSGLIAAASTNPFNDSRISYPSAEYLIAVEKPGIFDITLLLAGNNPLNDTVGFQIPTGRLLNGEQTPLTDDGRLLIDAQAGDQPSWGNAGIWRLEAGIHKLRVFAADFGVEFHQIKLRELADASGTITIPAEDWRKFSESPFSAPGGWSSFGDLGLISIAGPLPFVGQEAGYLVSKAPSLTAVQYQGVAYEVAVAAAGIYHLDLRAAGHGAEHDQLLVEIEGAVLLDNEHEPRNVKFLQTNHSGEFEWLEAGQWRLEPGVYQIRIKSNESNVGLDAFRLTPYFTDLVDARPLPETDPLAEVRIFFQRRAGNNLAGFFQEFVGPLPEGWRTVRDELMAQSPNSQKAFDSPPAIGSSSQSAAGTPTSEFNVRASAVAEELLFIALPPQGKHLQSDDYHAPHEPRPTADAGQLNDERDAGNSTHVYPAPSPNLMNSLDELLAEIDEYGVADDLELDWLDDGLNVS